MDQTTRRAMALDTQYQEHKITSVTSDYGGWTVLVEGGGYLFIPRRDDASLAPIVGETMRTYGRWHGYPVRGIVVGGRVHTYMTEAQENALKEAARASKKPILPSVPQLVTPNVPDPQAELDRLRRACRALQRLHSYGFLFDGGVGLFNEVTVDGMRRVLHNRGWVHTGTQPRPGEPDRVASETFNHPTALCEDRYGIIKFVKIPVDPTTGDWAARVHDWVEAMAIRHGDVSAAEILAEAL